MYTYILWQVWWHTTHNDDEVHDNLSRRACERHVSRVCRRNPIFYLDVVKMIQRLITSRTAWTLRRRENGIRQYKFTTASKSRNCDRDKCESAVKKKRYCPVKKVKIKITACFASANHHGNVILESNSIV